MKHRKSTRRTMALLLALFFLITGTAQGASPANQCKKACCQNAPIKSAAQQLAGTSSAHHVISYKKGPLACNPFHDYGVHHDMVSQAHQGCHDDAVPTCCKAKNSSRKVEDLASAPPSRTCPHLDISPVSFTGVSGLLESTRAAALAQFHLPVRAAPPPLYLKYSTFLC